MAIEELAFKDYQELKDIQKIDLLLIIEFLQKDRKQWVNQYSKAHNDYVDLQQENQELKDRIGNANWWLEEMLKQAKNDETKAIIYGTLDLLLKEIKNDI